MKKYSLLLFFLISINILPQAEMISLDNTVYEFLKEMKVKGIIPSIHDDNPNLTKGEVLEYLSIIEKNTDKLTPVEMGLLKRYKFQISDQLGDEAATYLFRFSEYPKPLGDIFTTKNKYLYAYEKGPNNAYVEGVGKAWYGHRFSPGVNNALVYDVGFKIHGTLMENFGYMLMVRKGLVSGNRDFATVVEPLLNGNFKFIENLENEASGNFDFTDGYLRYNMNPMDDLKLNFQIGREKIRFGYGYSNSLIMSGEHPNTDFIKFEAEYGSVRFVSVLSSAVGRFSIDRLKNYTKMIAMNKLQLSFDEMFDISIGESVIYSDRGIDITYLNPLLFYKFAEMSLQDRDNGMIWFDFQSDFFKNLEIQATFLLDENILTNMKELDRFTNKTAYQLGAYWYDAFTLPNTSLMFEYTKIRPYVYTHYNHKNTHTTWDFPLGHPAGPNSDEIMVKAAHNLTDRVRLFGEYRFTRRGENYTDAAGNVTKNVGGDIFLVHKDGFDSEIAPFLDGIRYNTNYASVGIRTEPFNDLIFELAYNYKSDENLTNGGKTDLSWLMFRFTMEY